MEPVSENRNLRISIQVSLSGYSFKVTDAKSGTVLGRSEGWLRPGDGFTTPEFQRSYAGGVDLALMTPKFALVPQAFLAPGEEREALSEVADLDPTDPVSSIPLPAYGAKLVYSLAVGETLSKVIAQSFPDAEGRPAQILPEMAFLLRDLQTLPEYNKIFASWADGRLYLAIAQGKSLQLASSYPAPDFTTAQYYLFLAIRQLQINPEASAIHFRTPLTAEDELSLYRYFKSVVQL